MSNMIKGLRKPNQSSLGTGFLDLFLNTAIGFAGLLIIALMLIATPTVDKKIDPTAEFLIIMTWPDYNPNDMDLWVKDPLGNIVSYKNKERGIMNLDRDDMGMSNDIIMTGLGETVVNPQNQEILSIRGFLEGTYTVNAFFFLRKYPIKETEYSKEFNDKDNPQMYTDYNSIVKPVPVTVQLVKVNPYTTLVTETEIFATYKTEKTMFNFTIVKTAEFKYEIEDINRDRIQLVDGSITL